MLQVSQGLVHEDPSRRHLLHIQNLDVVFNRRPLSRAMVGDLGEQLSNVPVSLFYGIRDGDIHPEEEPGHTIHSL